MDTIGAGQTVGKYLVIEEMGAGGAATVYRARDTESGEDRALKVLHRSASSDEIMQRRFVREVAVMQKVSHENVVRIYEGGLHEDTLFYAMELVDWGTLKDVLVGPLPWGDVAECGLQLTRALAVLHANEVVHRDLKPGNIYLSSSGHVKIGDFGLARDLTSSRLTLDGMTVGTVLYMPPEQITGADEIFGSADLYALGCCLFEMLTGHPPFSGAAATQVFEQHLKSPAPVPRASVPDCPEDLSLLIQRLMSKQAQDRPRDATAVGLALESILACKAVDFTELSAVSHEKLRPAELSDSPTNAPANSSEPATTVSHEGKRLTERLRESRDSHGADVSWSKLAAVLIGILVVITVATMFGARGDNAASEGVTDSPQIEVEND